MRVIVRSSSASTLGNTKWFKEYGWFIISQKGHKKSLLSSLSNNILYYLPALASATAGLLSPRNCAKQSLAYSFSNTFKERENSSFY